jgi:hypothetical protein
MPAPQPSQFTYESMLPETNPSFTRMKITFDVKEGVKSEDIHPLEYQATVLAWLAGDVKPWNDLQVRTAEHNAQFEKKQ